MYGFFRTAILLTGGLAVGASMLVAQNEAPPAGGHAELEALVSSQGVDLSDPVVSSRVRMLSHQTVDQEGRFPSANTCGTCHPDHYREWSVSQHAYAQMSPVFNAMHGTILKLTNGTNGDFCIRCHTPVGMNLGEPEFMSNMDRHPTSREGVTCIVCHRVGEAYSKVSGRLAIVEGDLFDPVYGPSGDEELNRVIAADEFSVNTERGQAGRAIHAGAEVLDQISRSGFCGTCHDVNLVNGFRLEEAFSEYKSTPAAAEGISCQDCHMGIDPGRNSGYDEAPAAVVGGRPTAVRKRTNHLFAGPDYSVIHPGIFPHNIRAAEMATIREWLTFDVEAGWGTDAFESAVPQGTEFPERWRTADDRYDAREIIDANLELLAVADTQRLQVLRAGYEIGDVTTRRAGSQGIEFDVEVKNVTNGHNVPTGFDAERLVFLQVTVRDASGEVVFQSGDRDPNGDVRDLHSIYVHDGELPQDKYLFSLQSKFLVRMNRGGEREQVLALNYSPSPLPFLRPSTRPTVLLGRPVGARKHRATIPPLKSNWANYQVDDDALEGTQGPYTAEVRLISQMIPVNLIHEIQGVGFDYYMSPREVADAVVEGAQVLWERQVELN
ncbi:MAG: cytochrome C [Gemmatimonadetes bacterium]|nr:cytochrome C [Gemmatimonadota bacterium]